MSYVGADRFLSTGRHRASDPATAGLPAGPLVPRDDDGSGRRLAVLALVVTLVGAVVLLGIALDDVRLCPAATSPAVTYLPAPPPARTFAPGGGRGRYDDDQAVPELTPAPTIPSPTDPGPVVPPRDSAVPSPERGRSAGPSGWTWT